MSARATTEQVIVKALVIGANGFIGSHLTDSLVIGGHEIIAFDRYTSPPTFHQTEAITPWVGEFQNQDDLARALVNVDMVFHFLSSSTPASAEADPTFDIRTNVAPSVELLRLCVDAGVSRVYFASSGGAIYGNSAREMSAETDVAEPVSPYAIGKLTIESYLNYFAVKHDLESVSVRISNPYGPRQHVRKSQGLIPIVLRSILAGVPVTQFGDGSMVRDYIFVNDLVDMITRTVDHRPRYRIYNLGSGEGYSVGRIFDLIREVTETEFEIVTKVTPSTFVRRAVLDVGRYEREFGRRDLTDLREGIARTWTNLAG